MRENHETCILMIIIVLFRIYLFVASRKSKRQISEEEGLILQLVETVNARNRLVNMLDLERLI